MKLIEIIKKILSIKNKVSLSELAGLSSKKKLEILDEVTKNKSLLKFNKNGCIVGLVNIRNIELEKKFAAGEIYTTSMINYGAAREINCLHSEAKKLEEDYWEGGFGDCRLIRVILDTEENRKKIEDLGIIYIDKAETITIEEAWQD